MIQLPKKSLDSWITFSLVSLRQHHSFFHQLIVAKLWFHFVVKFFNFVSLFQFLLVTNVNYQKSKALGPKNYWQNKTKKLQRQLKQGNKQRARKGKQTSAKDMKSWNELRKPTSVSLFQKESHLHQNFPVHYSTLSQPLQQILNAKNGHFSPQL